MTLTHLPETSRARERVEAEDEARARLMWEAWKLGALESARERWTSYDVYGESEQRRADLIFTFKELLRNAREGIQTRSELMQDEDFGGRPR